MADLTLGWTMTLGFHPEYWLSPDAKCGHHDDDRYLVRVPAAEMGYHTVIVAQSGSGKSFFLGRLIEEIAINTKARCVVFDPNADFRKVHKIRDASLWSNAQYDTKRGKGELPHEKNRTVFAAQWNKVKPRIRMHPAVKLAGTPYEELKLRWPAVTIASLSEDAEPAMKNHIYHLHEFVRVLGDIYRHDDLLAEAKRVLILAKSDPADLARRFNDYGQNQDAKAIERLTGRAVRIAADDWRRSREFYFDRADEYRESGILEENPDAGEPDHGRVEVIDLPSIKRRYLQSVIIAAAVGDERQRAMKAWELALEHLDKKDKRVPTFVVVDEAHNLMPDKPETDSEKSMREQFRTIAAEGRKYGMFLILVSQRPDKLDRLIISECENRAVMKLGSASVLGITREALGLDDVPAKQLEKCLDFPVGRALIVGKWSPDGPRVLYTAARRTVEGGRNLDPEHWAEPE